MDWKNFIEDVMNDIESKIPKWNGKKCSEGCNCVEIAEANNNGDQVKNYPCLKHYPCKIPTSEKD